MKLPDKTIQEIAELYNEIPAEDQQERLQQDWEYFQNTWRPFHRLSETARELLAIVMTQCDRSIVSVVEWDRSKGAWEAIDDFYGSDHDVAYKFTVYRIHEELECPDITAPLKYAPPAGDGWIIEDDKLFLTASERHMVPDPMPGGNLESHISNPADQLQTPNGRRWVRACWWVWSNYDQKLLVSSPVLHREGTAITPYLIDGKNIKSADICWVDGVVYLPE